MKSAKSIFALCLLALVCVGSASAQDLLPDDNGIFTYHQAPRWRESESHPLRIVGYALHPVGWVLREAIFRPFSALVGSNRVTKSIFGYREPFDYRNPMCFNDSDVIPDCHGVAPYNSIGGAQVMQETDGEAKAVPAERQIYFPDIAFEYDKSELKPLGKGRVRQVAQLLSSVPSLNVVVEGHTDTRGSDDYNNKLGTKRAETVVRELTELGIDPARMSPISYGKSRPVYTENEEWAHAVNRRVQFSVRGEGETAPAPMAAAEASSSNSAGLPAAKK